MSTPKLWSNFNINLAYTGESEIVEVVALYLDRSKTSPLHLELSALDEYEDNVDQLGFQSWRTFKLLLDAHTRWFEVKMNIGWQIMYDMDIERHLGTISSHCDILQSFSIRFGDEDELPFLFDFSSECPYLFHLLEKAPRLRSLGLHYFGKSFTLPFSTLAEISVLADLTVEEAIDCLSMCPNLRVAKFSIADLEHDERPGTQKMCCAKLSSLTCTFSGSWHDGVKFLGALTLPALIKPDLYGGQWPGMPQQLNTSLRNLLQRSHCQLGSLNLGPGFFASETELLHILHLAPKLIHLELESDPVITITFFENLTKSKVDGHGDALDHDDKSSKLLPQLTSLHIRLRHWRSSSVDSSFSLPDPEAILSMVKSRRTVDLEGKNKRLESFSFTASLDLEQIPEGREWKRSFTSVVEAGLQALKEDGLKLELQINNWDIQLVAL
ncbi:hypothetical protein VKT23_013608 [Stygiomarasmius scandens]|uniref:Uncharacterized protein n=1 Tax=Marasmiellus scandens TaxID=2682957 RepID=A0ABR1J6N9_9AGAR